MKSGLAVMIYAAHLLKRVGAPLRGRIGLCVVADEETGGQGGSRYLSETGLLGQDGIAMITPEPTSNVIWNASRGASPCASPSRAVRPMWASSTRASMPSSRWSRWCGSCRS